MAGGRFKEILKKYGKVGLGVHFSVSAASITGLYVAIKNNVDVESILERMGMPNLSKEGGESGDTRRNEIPHTTTNTQPIPETTTTTTRDGFVIEEPQVRGDQAAEVKKRNRTADLVASSGGALALAILINKALFPIRVPITIALTPPVARFLARRQIIKNSV